MRFGIILMAVISLCVDTAANAQSPRPALTPSAAPRERVEDRARISVTPFAGFGWTREGVVNDQAMLFRFGARADYRLGDWMLISATVADQTYRRQYLTDRVALDGSGLARAGVSEHKVDLDAGLFVDGAPLLKLTDRWVLALGLGPSFRFFLNEILPSRTGPAGVFARASVPVAERLQMTAHGGYSHNLVFREPLALSALGGPGSVGTFGASLEVLFPPGARFSAGYDGEVVTLKHSQRTYHSVMFLLSYAPGARSLPSPLRTHEAKTPPGASPVGPLAAEARRGILRGVVQDAKTGAPVADAIVSLPGRNRLLTDAAGQFVVDGVLPGRQGLAISRSGYSSENATANVVTGGTAEVAVKLLPVPVPPSVKAGAMATVRGTLASEKGALLAGAVSIPTANLASQPAPGEYSFQVPPGEHSIEASAKGFLVQGRRVRLHAGEVAVVDFLLRPAPKRVLVVLRADRIEIKRQVHFAVNSDFILPDSAQLLDEVAATILAHDDIKRIRIEGHTDAQGDDTSNLRLSQRRSDSVMRALVNRGVSPERLTALGYGETKPVAKNTTAAGRALNRRVDFLIAE